MAKQQSGVADRQVRLGERSYTLRFSVKALAALQDHWQLANFSEVGAHLSRLGSDMVLDDTVAIVWAAMRTHHAELDKEDVLDLIDAAGMADVAETLTIALGGSLPDAATGEVEGATGAPARKEKPGKTGR